MEMTDEDLMPFGKFKGTAMANVPGRYLLWLHENASIGARNGFPKVFEYILDNLKVIKLEIEDGDGK